MFVFDHAVIYVERLDPAITDYSALGFQITSGGEHREMGTHNALIPFQDHTYLELLAPAPSGAAPRSFLFDPGQPEGLTAFALRTKDLEKDLVALKERGIKLSAVQDGTRTRPDLIRVEWRQATLSKERSPFFIEDVTPRNLRISDTPSDIHHENEVVGVEELVLLVSDLERSIQKYTAILSELPRVDDGIAFFGLENLSLVLRPPAGEEETQALGKLSDLPYGINLRTTDSGRVGFLNPGHTHGVRIRLSGQADVKHL